MPLVKIDKDRCKGCSLCVANCPQKVLEMTREINIKGYFYAYPAYPYRCIGCRICGMVCPDTCIEIGIHGTQYHYFDY